MVVVKNQGIQLSQNMCTVHGTKCIENKSHRDHIVEDRPVPRSGNLNILSKSKLYYITANCLNPTAAPTASKAVEFQLP